MKIKVDGKEITCTRLEIVDEDEDKQQELPVHCPDYWEGYFQANVIDPDGWRMDGKDWKHNLNEEEFARRWGESTTSQPPSPELLEVLKRIGR